MGTGRAGLGGGVIGKVCRRGSDVGRLLGYLLREGRAGERGLASAHTDPHLIAGWDDPAHLQPARRGDGGWDLRRLTALLTDPLGLLPERPDPQPVYHLAISAAKDPRTGRLSDRYLSDAEWADIAAEYLHQIGLAPRDDPRAVRWIAVRHAADHIHVVATLARQDGRRVHLFRDYQQARAASHTIEARYQLTPTGAIDRTSTPALTQAEHRRGHDKAAPAARGRPPDRVVLRRHAQHAAAASTTPAEYAQRLAGAGVLLRWRHSTQDPDQITGYALALPPPGDQPKVWYGGAKLAPDLTLPALHRRWHTEPDPAGGPTLGGDAGRDPWEQALRAARHATRTLTHAAGRDTTGSAWAEADSVAHASADLLLAAAVLTEPSTHPGGSLQDALEPYRRASRPTRGHCTPSPAARDLRLAARGLLRHAHLPARGQHGDVIALLRQFASLTEALHRLRQAQHRLAQARAARTASQHLTQHLTDTARTQITTRLAQQPRRQAPRPPQQPLPTKQARKR